MISVGICVKDDSRFSKLAYCQFLRVANIGFHLLGSAIGVDSTKTRKSGQGNRRYYPRHHYNHYQFNEGITFRAAIHYFP
jgi:hypothetical protein